MSFSLVCDVDRQSLCFYCFPFRDKGHHEVQEIYNTSGKSKRSSSQTSNNSTSSKHGRKNTHDGNQVERRRSTFTYCFLAGVWHNNPRTASHMALTKRNNNNKRNKSCSCAAFPGADSILLMMRLVQITIRWPDFSGECGWSRAGQVGLSDILIT